MNADPDPDSDGTAITVTKPASISFFVTDLDGLNSSNSSKWRTTITVKLADETGQPMVDVKVFGIFGYRNNANCTTDANGLSSVTSSKFVDPNQKVHRLHGHRHGVRRCDEVAYQPDGNSGRKATAIGTNIVMADLATPIFIGISMVSRQ